MNGELNYCPLVFDDEYWEDVLILMDMTEGISEQEDFVYSLNLSDEDVQRCFDLLAAANQENAEMDPASYFELLQELATIR